MFRSMWLGLSLLLLLAATVLLLMPATQGPPPPSVRSRFTAEKHLRTLAVAMHDYHEAHGKLPAAAVFSKDGTPLLSWRVLILPYIGETNLYKQFKLDEPWDSANNRTLLERMPYVFTSPKSGVPAHSTRFQAFVGKGAAFEGTAGVPLEDFTDGTCDTLLLMEAAEAVPWTKPEDIPFGPDLPLPVLGTVRRGCSMAALADGSVRGILPSIGESTLRAAITRNAGDVLGTDW